MGLDISHNAFQGAYSSFQRFRIMLAEAMGGNWPEGYEDAHWYWGEGYSEETHPGLYVFFMHSDCDGEISPEDCVLVANEIEALIPKIEPIARKYEGGHTPRMLKTVRKFVAGCRSAAEANEPLEFG